MDDSEFEHLLATIPTLSKSQHQRLAEAMQQWTEARPVTELANDRADEIASCPHCNSTEFQRWGRAGGLQRYRCKQCGKTFNALTGTPLARLRKRECWSDFSKTLIEANTVQQAAQRCGVDPSTSFRWRHRFLDAMQRAENSRSSMPLSGIVEVAETRFTQSDKGVRTLQRPARRRGGQQHRGFCHPEQRVLLFMDRAGNGGEMLLEGTDERQTDLHRVPRSGEVPQDWLRQRVTGDALLYAVDDPAARQALVELGLPPQLLSDKSGEVTTASHDSRRALNLSHVNVYAVELLVWMQRFRGVSSRYLANYLFWCRMFHNESKESPETVPLPFLLPKKTNS